MDNQTVGGYPPYPQPNQGYQPDQQPNQGYQPYPQPDQGYQPAPQYQQPDQGYQPAPQYQQPNQGFQPTPQYQQPNQGFQPTPPYQPMPGGTAAVMPESPKKKKTGLIIGVIVVIVVALLAALVLSGNSPEKQFYGDWTFTVDSTEDLLSNAGEYVDAFDDDFQYAFKVDVTFNKDNTYSMTLDKESYDEASQVLYDQMKAIYINLVKEQLPEYANASDAEIEKIYEEYTGEKIDADFVELIDGTGYADAAEEVNDSGKFDVEGDKLMLSAGLEFEVDEDMYYIFEVVSDNEINCKEFYKDGVLDPDEHFVLIRK